MWVHVCVSVSVCVGEREERKSERERERWQKRAAHFPKNFVNSVETFEIYLQEEKKFNECFTVSDIQIQTTPRDSFFVLLSKKISNVNSGKSFLCLNVFLHFI